MNISHPIDFSHKRQARTIYAEVVLRVTENQYQDVVRLGLNNVYLAYVDVLAARQTVRYSRVSVEGWDKAPGRHGGHVREGQHHDSADVDQARSERDIAAIGLTMPRRTSAGRIGSWRSCSTSRRTRPKGWRCEGRSRIAGQPRLRTRN